MSLDPCAVCADRDRAIHQEVRTAERRRARSVPVQANLDKIAALKAEQVECRANGHPGMGSSREAATARHARNRAAKAVAMAPEVL